MKDIKEILTESFHRDLSYDEEIRLEEALLKDKKLRKEQEELKKTLYFLKHYEPKFYEGFEENVINTFLRKETQPQTSDLYPVFKKIMLGGIAAAAALLLSVYLVDGSFSINALFGLSELNSDELLLALLNF